MSKEKLKIKEIFMEDREENEKNEDEKVYKFLVRVEEWGNWF